MYADLHVMYMSFFCQILIIVEFSDTSMKINSNGFHKNQSMDSRLASC